LQRVEPDGGIRPLPSAEATAHLHLTLQEAISQFELRAPESLDPALYHSPTLALDYITVERLIWDRTDALKIMTVVLLVLIAVTGLYTVFMRSLHDLALGFGGVILGIWSVRAILVP